MKDYISNSDRGRRVFQGNFDNFTIEKLLSMLGCRVTCVDAGNGRFDSYIEGMHVYENDVGSMLSLTDSLE